MELFNLKILESFWNYQTKMIYENYNYMQIDFIGRTYNATIISISTRSILILYDIKATLIKLKPKKYIFH